MKRWTPLLVMVTLSISSPAWAQQGGEDTPPIDPNRCAGEIAGTPDADCVPVLDNFSVAELVGAGLVGVGAATVGILGQEIFGLPKASMGAPEPGSTDYDISRDWNKNFDKDEEMLGGFISRLGNPILPLAAGLYYAGGAFDAWFLEGDYMPDLRHEFLAFTEAVTWTVLVTHSLKFFIGRERPYKQIHGLDPEDVGQTSRETNLSFPGGHTSAVAATMGFMYLDISDALVNDVLKDSNPWTKFFVGRALPFSVTYGMIGLMTYERVWSQEHWLSDNLAGAAIGLTFAHAFYFLHFDDEGNPRRDHYDEAPKPQGISNLKISPVTLTGQRDSTMGLGLGFQWH